MGKYTRIRWFRHIY